MGMNKVYLFFVLFVLWGWSDAVLDVNEDDTKDDEATFSNQSSSTVQPTKKRKFKVPPYYGELTQEKMHEMYKKGPFMKKYTPINVHFKSPDLTRLFKSQNGDNIDRSQETPNTKYFGGIDIERVAALLHREFGRLGRDELGTKAMQAAYDKLAYQVEEIDGEKEIKKLEDQLQLKFKHYTHVVQTTKDMILSLYRDHKRNPMAPRFDCCNLAERDLRMVSIYGCKVSRRKSCDLIPRSLPLNTFNPGRNLTEWFRQRTVYWPLIKWLYFITASGLHTEFPAHNFRAATVRDLDCGTIHQLRHRDVFVRSVMPARMWVVLVLDHGEMSQTQLMLGKRVADILLTSLSEKDRVALLAVSDRVRYPARREAGECASRRLFAATQDAKQLLRGYIAALRDPEPARTNHTRALLEAFALIRNTLADLPSDPGAENILIAYISRGHVNAIRETAVTLNTVTRQQALLNNRVVINTYMLVEEKSSTVLFEKTFMQDLATRWTAHADTEFYSAKDVRPGHFVTVNRTSAELESTVGEFYKVLLRPKMGKSQGETVMGRNGGMQYSLPYRDLEGGGLVMSISQPYIYEEKLIGVFGVDLHLADIVDVVTYYNRDRSAYAFLVHEEGYTVMHPSLARPINTRAMPMHTDIRHFEKYPGFEAIRQRILKEDRGNATLMVDEEEGVEEAKSRYTNTSGSHTNKAGVPGSVNRDAFEPRRYHKATYHWRRIRGPDTPFIVVLKTMQMAAQERRVAKLISNFRELHYHRLDLFNQEHVCVYYKHLATFAFSTMFLSARSFKKPFSYLAREETREDVQHLVAYLSDSTGLISSPGISSHVRSDVAVVEKINKFWLHRHKLSKFKDYIVRRYVATTAGVVRMYPGTLLHKAFDPTTREWYMKALQYPGKAVFTGPYLDSGGAGYIVTLSYTIFEGRSSGIHSPEEDRVVAVIAVDFTYRFLYQFLRRYVPPCDTPTNGMRCFIMEDRGYLVAHPGFMQPRLRGPSESNHVTHREPLIADDVLNHEYFVRKTLCNSYNDRTIQRVYTLNMTLNKSLTNLVNGEHCAKYQIVRIPSTNTFLGLVNETRVPNCGPRTAFCPCSTLNRECLNCRRMEQSECECPCECPLRMEVCSGRLLREEDQRNPSCPRLQETDLPLRPPFPSLPHYPSCHSRSQCASLGSKTACSGVVGCEWCEMQPDGSTSLPNLYCSLQDQCFGGVLGAPSPYQRSKAVAPGGSPFINDMENPYYLGGPGYGAPRPTGVGALGSLQGEGRSTPVGPVTGGVMGCFILIALAVYCYRHRALRRAVGHPYQQGLQENQNGFEELLDDPSDDASLALAQFESNPAGISPYRVSTSYRRPAVGASSTTTGAGGGTDIASTDQGYSSTVGGPANGVDTDPEASTVVSEPASTRARSVVSEPDSAVGSSVAGSECTPRLVSPPAMMQYGPQMVRTPIQTVVHHPLMQGGKEKFTPVLPETREVVYGELGPPPQHIIDNSLNPGQTNLSSAGRMTQVAVPVQIHSPPVHVNENCVA